MQANTVGTAKRSNDFLDLLLVGQLIVDAETVSISRAPDLLLEYGEIQLIWRMRT